MGIKRYVALDTETTGKGDDGTPGDHRIIEVGCVEILGRQITGRTLQLYVDPERPVDEEAAQIHGWTWEKLKGKPKFAEVASQIIDFIRGSELLIHNAKFDTSFLDKEWLLLGMSERTADMAHVIDTVSLARKLVPGRQVNLDNLCSIFDIDASARTLHGALLDAELLAEVFLAMTGGQEELSFGDRAASSQRWKRPQGAKLPLMAAERERELVHRASLVSLSQSHKISDGPDGKSPIAGSDWGPGFESPFLTKGLDESGKSFKGRLAQEREKVMQRLFSPEERQILDECLARDAALQKHWEDRVLGKCEDDDPRSIAAKKLADPSK
ncbi:MAG: DNA polymerase III subunit epsilon [Succinivibrio sp.]|jgi:DNA polymerase III epsilon subunit|nr:DNA polymerase III subunit epsilon [Succinivibrio sp.]